MAKKVLGQSNPAATTATTLYTVPSGKEATISSLVVANLSTTTAATYRVAVRPGGASLANQHYVTYDVSVGAADSTILTIGITMAATDVLTVYASTANIAFSAFGAEVPATA